MLLTVWYLPLVTVLIPLAFYLKQCLPPTEAELWSGENNFLLLHRIASGRMIASSGAGFLIVAVLTAINIALSKRRDSESRDQSALFFLHVANIASLLVTCGLLLAEFQGTSVISASAQASLARLKYAFRHPDYGGDSYFIAFSMMFLLFLGFRILLYREGSSVYEPLYFYFLFWSMFFVFLRTYS